MCMHVWLMPTAFLRRQRTFSDGSMQASGLQNPRLDSVIVVFFTVTVFFHRHCQHFFFFFFHICPSCNISPGSENAVNKLNTGRKYTQMQKNGCWHLWETVKQNVLLFSWTWTWIWPFIHCPRLIWNWIKAFLFLFFKKWNEYLQPPEGNRADFGSEMRWCRAITHNHKRGSDSKCTLSPVNIAK